MRAIALLTDFGTRDPYVAAMKGVIAARTDVPLHDLSHEIEPFDVFGAAWFLRTVMRYWPAGTVFVCVVDPGVGTSRAIIAVESEGRTFLAPDNGLLTFIDGDAFAVTNASFFLPEGSSTFHGRDRFAPVAAAIANGTALEELGPRTARIALPYEPNTIVAIDRFGNAITDIDASALPCALVVRDHVIDRLEHNYGDAAPGPFLIVGSTGCIEISMKNASAAERLQLRRLERVEVRPV
jgi:S-adenosylmethionine hydrolase